ncbi:uncharacterized protein CCOS01_06935 [Colletotrichum costaricense]|uniref:Uncharacterized protein n=1 Tax=Colletotrichum costaricense TaxID=1209916 RepID=A0AAI9Z0G6_9PEZI|nr:uncharacterized protein CCOS01_06935 [Colletotrichum costaricense]KAK1529101.1 hypothetical protein CCOS01_06935 [Colletotrichum costaricense]
MNPARSSGVLNAGDQAPPSPPVHEHAGSTPTPQTFERRQATESSIDVERQCGVPLPEGRRTACEACLNIIYTLWETIVQQDGAREGFHGGGVPQFRTRTFVLYYVELLQNRPAIFTPSIHVEELARVGIAPADVEKLKRVTRRHFHIVCDATRRGGRHGS